jgi:hypothetical protein
MKILVANLSGNMGKTTIVKHLLSPRMKDAQVVCLESINSGANEISTAIHLSAADEFGSLVDILAIQDELIVDLGSSESKELIRKLKEYETAIHDFDYVLVPVVPDPKAQEDTISTVMTLNALNLPKEKIKILFNKVPVHMAGKVSVLFSPLIDAVQGMAIIDPNLVIYQFDIFNALKGSSITVSDVDLDDTDWKAVARDTTQIERVRIEALQQNRNKKAAPTAMRNLDAVFDSLIA